MTITNGYCTLADLRQVVYQDSTDSHDNDKRLEAIIESASRLIDKYCNRRFYAASETRYYMANDYYELQVDDITAVTTLKTDENGDGVFETTWTTSDYNLWPYNALTDGKPYTMIEISEGGSQEFPVAVRKGVQVVGVFGYVASTAASYLTCPDIIHDACLLVANRIWKRNDTPLGVTGSPQLGEQTVRIPSLRLDPDVADMLAPYRRVI